MQALFTHDMPNISFASGGDVDTLDFVAYVAKDRENVRSCFVLECGGGLAQDVITSVGQAFELRSVSEFVCQPVCSPNHSKALFICLIMTSKVNVVNCPSKSRDTSNQLFFFNPRLSLAIYLSIYLGTIR